ncbi:hypothetical protein NC653_013043 [Populus alba x Populus x berolinensis]|uniref:Uncharacterized protein n=1 Tax=Populus alba x Populus x berolinensis TaxID=444605 RepID=A0AAD6QUC3_9ROSI|nr:hypothetical protein NC653_013043 [Populus alba x Populus x berolinensis]
MQLGHYNMNLVGDFPSMSSLINQSFGNGGWSSGLSGLESNPISMVANDVGFSSSSDGFNMVSSGSSGKVQSKRIANSSGNHQPQVQQFEPLMLSHGQKQFHSIRGSLGAMGPVKLEPQVFNEQIGPQRRLQSLQSLGSVKLEPLQNQIGRGTGPVKVENQLSVQSNLRQQQLLHMSRQSTQAPAAQMNYLQQQQQQPLRAFRHQQPQMQQFNSKICQLDLLQDHCMNLEQLLLGSLRIPKYSAKRGEIASKVIYIESLAQFPCRTRPFSGLHSSDQQPPEKKQHTRPTSNDDLHSVQASVMHPSTSNGVASANNSPGTSSTSSSAITVARLFQNSVNSRIENQMTSPGSPYTGTFVQIPSAVSSTTLTLAQLNPSSPFSCLTPSSSNNPQSSHNMLAASTAINHVSSAHSPVQTPMEQSSQSNEVDPNEFQSSVEKIIQEMMISSQFSGAGGMVSVDYEGNDIKDINRVTRSTQNVFTSGPCLEGNVMGNKKSGTMDGGFGSLNGQNHLSASTSRFTAAMGNVSSILSGRLAMPVMDHDAGMNHQQQALAYQLRLGAVNRFLDNQFD